MDGPRQTAKKSTSKTTLSGLGLPKNNSFNNLRESSTDSLASCSNDSSFFQDNFNQGRDKVSRALHSLSFQNPGRKNAEILTTRVKRRDAKKTDSKPPHYDNKGQLNYDGHVFRRICDCFRDDCNGCFSKCKKCESRKCGPICQINRKYVPFKTVEQGEGGQVWKNPNVPDSLMNKMETDTAISESDCSDSDY